MSSIAVVRWQSIAQLFVFFVFFVLFVVNLPAAQTNWNSKAKAHANPAIARAIERRTMAPAKPRVVMQHAADGEVVSVMADGTVVREPLKRASTARIPEALGRVRIDAALARIVAASKKGRDDNDKVARKLEQLADKLEKGGNGKLAGILDRAAVAASAATAAYLAGRKGRTA